MNHATRLLRCVRFVHLAVLACAALAAPALTHAQPVVVARQQLADGEYAAMKKTLDAHLRTAPADQTALALRALANLGIAAETTVPLLLRKSFGAQTANFDVTEGGLELFFPIIKAGFARTSAFAATGSAPALTYNLSRTFDASSGGTRNDIPGISFQNNSGEPYPLVFRLGLAGNAPGYSARTFFRVNSTRDPQAVAETEGATRRVIQFAAIESGSVVAGPASDEVTATIPPGAVLDVYVLRNTGGTYRITPVGPLPSTLAVRNGQVLVSISTLPARTVPLNAALVPAQALQASVAADLAKLAPGFQLALVPDETGAATDLILAYPDAQLLLAEIRLLEALRNLSLSYNLGFKFNFNALDTEALDFLARNPAFLSPLPSTSGLAAARRRARDFLRLAIGNYENASDAGLWTRPAPLSGAYLFTPAAGTDPAAEKLRYDTAFAQLALALAQPVPLADLSPELASDSALPPGATLDLAALFSDRVVNLRALVPTFDSAGDIVPGSSLGLVNSGLFPGLDITGWDAFLTVRGRSSASDPFTDNAAFAIRRQSLKVAVPEGSPALLSVFADAFPPPAYRWQRLNGKAAATPLPATTPTLRLEAATRADAGLYQAIVTDNRAPRPPRSPATVTSKPIELVVTYAPEITADPVGGTFAPRARVTLSVAADGAPRPLLYQWRRDGRIILKATKSTYAFTASATTAGVYDVVVTNLVGTATSAPATVVVTAPPVVTALPAQTFHAGENRSLAFTVSGSGPLDYAWFRPSSLDALPGQDGSALILSPVTAADAGRYRLRAANPYGQTLSSDTLIRVNVPPARLPAGTTLRLVEGDLASVLTVATTQPGDTRGTFADGSAFEYKLKGESLRSAQGVLTGATLVRTLSLGGRIVSRITYDLGFTDPAAATYAKTTRNATGTVIGLQLNNTLAIAAP